MQRTSPLQGANLAINLNLTSICNLNCGYCFAEGGDYGRITGQLEADSVPEIFRFIDDTSQSPIPCGSNSSEESLF